MLDLTRWKNRKKIPGSRAIEPRIRLLAIGLAIMGLLIIGKLFDFQVLKFGFYSALASDQQDVYKKLFPERGSIYVKDKGSSILAAEENLYPLAINKDYNLVYAQPKYMDKKPEDVAALLAPILEPDETKREALKQALITKLSKTEDPYEPLMHKVEDSVAEAVNQLKIKGILTSVETYRFYPEKNIGANILGYVGFADNGTKKGYYGIEGYFDKELSGEQGEIQSETDITGNLIPTGDEKLISAQDGNDIVLTIDKTLQFEVCSELDAQAQKVQAENGAVIILNPKTGAIIAMCSYPDFDPNEYNKAPSPASYNNEAIFEPYEPGSIFKAVTMATGLDLGKIKPDTTFVDKGEAKIDNFTIRDFDHKAHGLMTMTQVLENSLNLGTIFVVQQLDKFDFYNYLKKFGFGKKIGIELATENAGDISSLQKKGDIYTATASFGQGIMATPLQMVAAYAAIANNGKMVHPYIVDEIRHPDGMVVTPSRSQPVQVISSKTSTLLTGMLASVVTNGQGKKVAVPGYYLAAKSGTAQIAVPGGYSANETNHSYIGFGPISDPAFVMIVKLGKPKMGKFAESTAAPLWGKLAKFILDYYHVVPDNP